MSKYKKRVISESDDSADEGDDTPLASAAGAGAGAGAGAAAVPAAATASTTASTSTSTGMQKTDSAESNHNAETVADGAAILKAAAHDGNGNQPTHLEDAEVRHEIAAGGFPTDVPAATTTNSTSSQKQTRANDDEDSDDDKPLASAKPASGALPSFKKKKQSKDESSTNGKSKKDKPKSKSKAPNTPKVKREDKDGDVAMSSDDDRPLAAKAKSNGHANGNGKKASPGSGDSSDDDDKPLAARTNKPDRVKKGSQDMDVDSDDDAPLAGKAKKAAPAKKSKASDDNKPAKGKKRAKKEDSDAESDFAANGKSGKAAAKPAKKRVKKEESASPVKKSTTAKVKKEEKEGSATPSASTSKGDKKGKQKAKKEEGSQNGSQDGSEDEAGWWAAHNVAGEQGVDFEDDGPKWTTLEHNGVLFAPPYVPLPKNIKMKYDGKPVDLPPEAEEVATFFAAMLETDHAKDETFQSNFYKGFTYLVSAVHSERKPDAPKYLPRNGITIPQDFELGFHKCDFRDMYEYIEADKAAKKNISAAEKKRNKAEKDEAEKKYMTCLVDGREEKVGNFRLEPPGLFRGRGEHPKKGTVKQRIHANQVTINIGPEAKVPEPPAGEQWKEVKHNNTVTWLAMWKENINKQTKYVYLAAGSSWKGQSDFKKFEKARRLKNHIDEVRKSYEADLKSKEMLVRQRAVAVYLIDRFALRVGGEKDEEAEADTVGCCSLRFEHVTLREPNFVTFDFLGKDSIRFYQPDKEVDLQVFKSMKKFKTGGKEGDQLFDRIQPMLLNQYLQSFMKGLTAKVFRTYNASIVLQQQLTTTPADASIADKILHYNRANRLVAELCNHQRAAPKTHSQSMEKLADKLKAVKYQRMKLRYALWAVDDGNKKKHKEYRDLESDLDDDWMEAHELDLVEKEKEKIRKKHEKANEKRAEEGEAPLTQKELDEQLEGADEMGELIKEERVTKKVEPKKSQTTAKILEALVKIDQRIDAQKIAAVDKEEGKEISLTTSKINYMDPRVTVAWCKKYGVPLEKMFAKTLRTKFVWAMEVPEDWQF